jgi:anti-sigma factor RsiW
VASWFRGKVDFPVRPPQLTEARLVGARFHRIQDRDGAYLTYDHPGTPALPGGRKVSVFVFDPHGADPRAELSESRRVTVGQRDVYMGQRGAYRSAVFQRDGVGYVVTADMDEASMLRLVSGAVNR